MIGNKRRNGPDRIAENRCGQRRSEKAAAHLHETDQRGSRAGDPGKCARAEGHRPGVTKGRPNTQSIAGSMKDRRCGVAKARAIANPAPDRAMMTMP